MARSTHRVAVVVFCEAEGVDELDASHGAQMALRHALRQTAQDDAAAQEKVGSSREPACSTCGARAGTDEDGLVSRHVSGERFFPDADPDVPDYRPVACPGTGQAPQPETAPIVGFDRGDRLPIYARVHEVMDAGMALGNGYLWAGVTSKAFRS